MHINQISDYKNFTDVTLQGWGTGTATGTGTGAYLFYRQAVRHSRFVLLDWGWQFGVSLGLVLGMGLGLGLGGQLCLSPDSPGFVSLGPNCQSLRQRC